jgi:hypothetical protein
LKEHQGFFKIVVICAELVAKHAFVFLYDESRHDKVVVFGDVSKQIVTETSTEK